MNAFSANWFDGQTSRMHSVTVERIAATAIRVSGGDVDRTESIAALRISPRLARIARTIEFPDGARLLVSDHPLLDTWFPNENRLQGFVDRLERHAHAVAVSIVICIVMGIATFTWGVPWLSDRIAAQVPESVETRLGAEVLAQLDRIFGFAPSELEAGRQAELSARFARIADGMPSAAHYRLEFRSAPSVGPNALAVPGGTVVVTDELIDLFDDDREFDAVIAHELGHQEHRHALRQTLRSSFVLVIAALFTGDVSSASAIVVAVPTFLLQSHYSRGFEEEADGFAFTTLAAHATSPAWFASAMRKLDEHASGADDDGMTYLSSHPSHASRIDAAEVAGVMFLTEHPELARETPDYDACEEEDICPDEHDGTCKGDGCGDNHNESEGSFSCDQSAAAIEDGA
jgi:Zn-dependent protease with chaperone function